MAFTGTLDKCKACDKKVYFVDLLTVDGVIYHKNCFKCVHCKGLLVMSNYSSFDGVLYCKPHFEQLFKESGTFTKYFQTQASPRENLKPPSKHSSLFSGSIDKCIVCDKIVYPLEKITMEEQIFHKSCFKCVHAGCPLTHFSYAALDGVLYCRTHFAQLFLEKGNFAHVLEAANLKKIALKQQQQQDEIQQPVSPIKSPQVVGEDEEKQEEKQEQEQEEEQNTDNESKVEDEPKGDDE